jgi:hypothetical protein
MNGPATAGTYAIKLVPTVIAGGGTADATGVTLTITVTANPATDKVATTATTVLSAGETVTAGNTTDAVISVTRVVPNITDAVANISVVLKNAAGALTTGESYTAVLTGSGTLGSGPQSTLISGDARGRAITVQAGHSVTVYSDGSSGVGTIVISSTAGVVLGTKSVKFFGSAVTITATTAALTTGSVGTIGSAANLVAFVVKDLAGTDVTTGTFYSVTSSVAIANTSVYTACSSYSATLGWLCPITGVAKGTATFYVTNRSSATDTTVELRSAETVSIRIGDKIPASVTVTADKSTYLPGEKIVLTATLRDSDGNVVPSGTYTSIFATGGIASTYAVTGDTTTATSVDGAIDGVKKFNLFAPLAATEVTFSWKTGVVTGTTGSGLATANQDKAGSVVISTKGDTSATDAATAAAEEATAAANDATDAALSAAEAAEAATAIAQEAVDAVAELSASVTKLISALRAQITTLTKLVVKIQKKVKA